MKDLESIKREKTVLVQIHFSLASLSYFNSNVWAAEESLIEDWDFIELLKREWGGEILSSKSYELLNIFRAKWLVYKKSVNYSGDHIFIFFDKNWKIIIEKNLLPVLDSIEKDFNYNGIEYVSYTNYYDSMSLPSKEDILQRGEILYKLLLENGIVKKSYMK